VEDGEIEKVCDERRNKPTKSKQKAIKMKIKQLIL